MASESLTDSNQNQTPTESEFGLNLLAATLAHEIRNPLQAMRLQIDAVSKSATQADAIKSLSKNLDRLESVVRRVERLAHRYALHLDTVNLREVRDSVFSSIRFWLEAGGVEVVEAIQWEGDPMIQGDRELIEQVILNLVMNAIQAMPEGGRLEVSVNECQHSAEIEIIDSGIGMNAETLKLVGTPFFTTKTKGSGLGVAFCRSIVALHGGTIEFESKPDEGTLCRVRLPKEIRLEKEGRVS
jgi:signal transduction histidine kinase